MHKSAVAFMAPLPVRTWKVLITFTA